MKFLTIGLAAAGVLALAGAALADTPPASTDQQTSAATPPAPKKHGFDPNAIVCKQVAVTDTHLPGDRVCMTWAQWEEESQADQRDLHDAMDRPGRTGVPGGFGGH